MDDLKLLIREQLSTLSFDRYLICCSGGPDSVLLLHLIAAVSDAPHHVVYFNHQLRSEEVHKEIELVESLSKMYGYTCHIELLSAEKKTQANYRELRIERAKFICKTYHLSVVMTGHHLNDDIETLWMQFYKGATTNFRGIPTQMVLDNIAFCHPLLRIPKQDILSCLLDNNWSYCLDSSNDTFQYTRNKLRKALSDLDAVFSHNPKQLSQTMTFLKNNESNLIQRASAIQMTKILGGHWLDKSHLNAELDPLMLIKVLLEHRFNQYVNSNDGLKLQRGLDQQDLVLIPLQTVYVVMDYKWVVVLNHPLSEIVLGSFNFVTNTYFKTQVGTTIVTEWGTSLPSNRFRYCLNKDDLVTLKFNSIAKCPFPSKKKLYRSHGISPIEQYIYPVFFNEDGIVWIPNVFNQASNGTTIITFSNLFNFETLSKK